MPRQFSTFLKWGLTSAALAGAVLVLVFLRTHFRDDSGAAESKPQPKVVAGRIKLGAAQAKERIKVEPAVELDWLPRLTVYGRVIQNPAATTEVRAPFAGKVAGEKWPALGAHVKPNEIIGKLEVRWGPAERLDLEAKLSEATSKEEGAGKIEQIQKERLKRLEAAGPSVVRNDLEAAMIAVAEAQTQRTAAANAAKLWQSALAALDTSGAGKETPWGLPLTTTAGGEVTELVGRPGTTVEAGALLARIVDVSKVLARVDVPLSVAATGPPETLELVSLPATPPGLEGPTNRPEAAKAVKGLKGRRIGVAGNVDPGLQTPGYLYEVDATGAEGPANLWRPGLYVRAQFKDSEAKPILAIAVPGESLLFHQGRALVYVQLSAGVFRRTEVRVLGREGERWVVTGDLDDGDLVVTEGAMLLLSEEFRTDVDED